MRPDPPTVYTALIYMCKSPVSILVNKVVVYCVFLIVYSGKPGHQENTTF